MAEPFKPRSAHQAGFVRDHDELGPVARVEQVVLATIVPGVEKWLPTSAAIGLTKAPGPNPGHALSPTTAGLVLTGYVVALLVAASRTTMRRDVA